LSSKTYHQRGETIMAQGVLPFKYEAEKKTTGMTSPAQREDTNSAVCVINISLSGKIS